MSDRWAIRMSVRHLQRAGELRAWPSIEAADSGDVVWLRGDGLDARGRALDVRRRSDGRAPVDDVRIPADGRHLAGDRHDVCRR